VVLSVDGEFIRTFGLDSLTSPSGITVMDDGTILITELFGSVTAFTNEGEPIGSLGYPIPVDERRAGWPNTIDATGNTSRPELHRYHFNSPHGICCTGGAILVTEWVIGGRVIRLAPI
jgi:hypothetical protein